MKDVDLYAQILGITHPWFVADVKLQAGSGRVDIWLDHKSRVSWACPECGCELACRDHSEERTWRHLDTCQFKTFIHARIPRVRCPEHGVRQVDVPWAEPRSRFTLLMERLVIDVLTECATVEGARKLMRLSWDEVYGVMKRAVRRGMARKKQRQIRYLGVDEKAFRKGHSYMTVVCDLIRGSVEFVAEERKTASLEEYFRSLTPEQLETVKAVSMDMWSPYFLATQKWVPDAAGKIVFDRFHVMKHVGEAVDRVRRQEHKGLLAEKDDTLKGTKYFWLYREENVPDKYRARFETLRAANLKTAKAWAMKESLQALWEYLSPGWAKRFLRKWCSWAVRSGLPPMKKVAQTLRSHMDNIVTFCRHRITNGVAEGLNSKIMSIKRRACGYRNRDNFKAAIYFFCGGLDLYPYPR
ncbi:ISL3 family transposase [Oleidesulfovibrio alaskensis]